MQLNPHVSTQPFADPLVGKTVAHYTILAKLGGGGMGVVYQAKDARLGRLVALKFLPPQWSHDESAKQRFIREAQAASATDHPNICTIHDIGAADDGQLFIVMAHYEGQTLKQKLEAGAIGVDEALLVATQIADGLAKAHAQGVVHRDIKPGNLMITEDGVRILDFGLAKFADSLQLTMAGSTLGTVAYMSPEQARGEEADARSDLWAVGVVLYEMLTGETPFKGIYPEAISYAIRNDPTPPFRVEERVIPAQVGALVLRALEKDPAERYQSARELARDLRILQGRTLPLDLGTVELPPMAQARVPARRSFWRRVWNELTPTRAAAGALAVIAMGAVSYLWIAQPVVRIPIAIAPVANHAGEPELDAYRLALTESLIADFRESPNLRAIPYLRLAEIVRPFMAGGADVSSREAIQAISTTGGVRFIVIPILVRRGDKWLAQAELRSVESGALVATVETEGLTSSLPKDTTYRLMASLATSVQDHFGPGGTLDAALARWHASLGFRQKVHDLLNGRRPAGERFRTLDAARAFERGLNAYEQLEYAEAFTAFRTAAAEDSQHASTQAWLSRVLLILNRGNEAVAAALRARQLAAADASLVQKSSIDAILAESQGNMDAANEHYRRRTILQSDDPAAQAELAGFLKRQNRDREAVDAYRKVLRLDSGYIRPHVELCQLYTRLDEQPLAGQEARIAVQKYRDAHNRPGEAQALLCLGELQRVQGNFDDARQNVEAARDIFESLGQPYALSRVYQYLGTVAGSAGNFQAAVSFFEEALSRSRQIGNRQIEGLELMNLGVAHEALGHRGQALRYYEQSRDVYQQISDERSAAEQQVNAANLVVNYGTAHDEALGRLAAARATLRKLGNVLFDVAAMQVEAESRLHAGRHAEARRQLREALSLARERHLSDKVLSLTVDLARSHFLMNEYEAARALLEEAVAGDAGRSDAQARIALARVYVRLGDFESVRTHLQQALANTDIDGSLQTGIAPIAHLSLGELAYESGQLRVAAGHFDKAGALWTDNLPDAASVEARCHQATIESVTAAAASLRMLEKSIEQAAAMGRLYLEAECRVHLARFHVSNRHYGEAVAALDRVPPDGQSAIGPELRAQVHYWRSRAVAGRGDRVAAGAEAAQARALLEQLRTSVPEPYRDRFASRSDIRPTFEETVQKSR